MKQFQRFLFFLYSVALLAASVLGILFMLGLEQPAQDVYAYLFQPSSRWITAIAALAISLISLYVFFKSIKKVEKKPQTENQLFVSDNQLGRVSVSISALENVITKAARAVDGAREITPNIKSTNEGAAVYLKVMAASTVNIPEFSDKVQEKVQEKIRDFAGIDAVEIRVHVESISQEVKGSSIN